MNLRKALFAIALFACLVLARPERVPAQQGGPRQPDMTVDAAARKEVIENLIKRLNDAYVFPDTAAKMEQDLRARAARGEYEQITSAQQFAEKLTADLREVSHDKHLGVQYSARPLPQDLGPKEPT